MIQANYILCESGKLLANQNIFFRDAKESRDEEMFFIQNRNKIHQFEKSSLNLIKQSEDHINYLKSNPEFKSREFIKALKRVAYTHRLSLTIFSNVDPV